MDRDRKRRMDAGLDDYVAIDALPPSPSSKLALGCFDVARCIWELASDATLLAR